MSNQPSKHLFKSIEPLSYWQHHIAAFNGSHLSKAAYCRQHDVNYDRLLYWINKLVGTKSKPRLLPVTLATPNTSKMPYMVELKQGHKIHVNELSALTALLAKLGG